jgi:hypothetical protein
MKKDSQPLHFLLGQEDIAQRQLRPAPQLLAAGAGKSRETPVYTVRVVGFSHFDSDRAF